MDLKEFKIFRNQLTKELQKAKTTYYQNSLNSSSQRTDIIWKKVNSVLQRNRQHDSIENLIIEGKELAGTALANAFNDHFVNLNIHPYSTEACVYIKEKYREHYFFRTSY